jgi:hypothetical protein
MLFVADVGTSSFLQLPQSVDRPSCYSPSSWESNNEPKKVRIWACERFDLICIQFIRVRARRAAELHRLFKMGLDAKLAKRELYQKG